MKLGRKMLQHKLYMQIFMTASETLVPASEQF